jgi:YidC/Oxa1 family membrane protein insertase
VKRKHLLLFAVLALSMLVLSGCGVPREGVDVATVAPEGLWQTLAVWPLAKTLIWMYDVLSSANIPYAWGFAIILFTVIIKAVTFPLTMTQLKGMQAQKDLQPKLKELQKKYGKDREKISQEQMKLYQEAGVNPLSGCLPLVVQMPVLFGLYSALVALGGTLVNAHFFWIPDLGFPAYSLGLSWIPEAYNAGNYSLLAAYLVLPALLMITQFVMQRMTNATTTVDPTDTQGNMMKQMGLMMSLMFGFFTLQVPAGLSLYWVTSNLLQLVQQWFVANRMNLNTSPTPALAGSSSGKTVVIDGKAINSETGASSDGDKASTAPVRRKKRKRK